MPASSDCLPVIHPSADVSESAVIGVRTKIWHRTQICAGAHVGDDCIVGSNVYIDRGVVVGNRAKIQTAAQLYHGAVLEDGVFVGPMVCLTNDKYPRAITPDGRLQTDTDWEVGEIHVLYGASLGAGSIVLPNVTIGRFALVAAGAVVAQSVPDHVLVAGQPARRAGYVCACGRRLRRSDAEQAPISMWMCVTCGRCYTELPDGGLRAAEEV